jgi:outer membrane lipoprotein SlyB
MERGLDMNTTTTPNPERSGAGGIHRGVWIGGGLMALTIVALATTLVVKNNDALPDPAAVPAVATAAPQSPIANESVTTAQQPVPAAAVPAPVYQAPAPVRQVPARNDASNTWNDQPQRVAAAPVCATCGVIEGYSAVQVHGQNNGVGAVAGGLGGALVGSQIAGRNNHTLGGVLGAVGGGLLGNAIESHERTVTVYDVRVRMADGSIRTLQESHVPNVGQRVHVEGHTMRAIDDQG